MARARPESPRSVDLPDRAEQRLLDLVAARLPVVLYHGRITGSRLVLDFVSPAAEQRIGRSPEDLCGRDDPISALLHPDDRDGYEQALALAARTGSATAEYRIAMGAKRYAWFRDEMSVSPAGPAAPDGTLLVSGCILDITEERKAALAREEIVAQCKTIIDQALHPIFLCDHAGRILESNHAARALFLGETAETDGTLLKTAILARESRDAFQKTVDDLLQRESAQAVAAPVNLMARSGDGRELPVEALVSTIDFGNEPALVAELRDVSERVSAEAEIERLWRLMQNAVNSMPNGFAIYDADEKLVLCNTAYSDLYGETPETMVGTTAYETYRRAMPLFKSFGGHPEGQLPTITEVWRRQIHESENEPIEFELKSGGWKQTTTHPLLGGGRVYVRTDITKLKEAEISLRKGEQQFRELVENNPFPLWLTDVETGIVLYHSPEAAALLGYDWPVTELYKSERSYADPEDRVRCTAELMERGRLDGRETLLRRADGSVFWGAVFSRLGKIDGKTIAIGGVVDLTEQREKEAQIRQAQETLQDAVESLPVGFALYDADDLLVTCNQRYRDFNKQSADILTPGVRWIDFIRAGAERGQYVGAEGRVEEWLAERKRLRMQFGTDMEFQQSDGRWFQFANQPTRQGGIVVTRTDITARKEMERALRESENLVRSILEASPVPVAMTRASDGLIIYESPASRLLFGQLQQSGEPSYVSDVYVDPGERQRYLKLLRERGTLEGFEVEFRKADGSHIWVSITSSLIEYQGEEMVVASAYDLTERRAVEAEMARQREALYQSEKLSALGSLLAGVAHELNNPLSVVVGHAQLMKETAGDPRIVERATKIGNAADRCSRIVKSFLAMARQRPPERRAVDLKEIVQATLDVTGYSLRTANIEVAVDFDPTVPSVHGDPDQLNQVVTNLIVNAQQAMMEVQGARRLAIAIRYDAHREEILLEIADSGPGIPEENRSRIFDPFFTTKDIGEGTGVGLAVTHRIVEAHDGRISVAGEPSEGAVFTVGLPASGEPTGKPGPRAAASPAGPCTSAKVLIIDDEPDVAQMLADILEAEGHEVETADSGEKALALLDRQSFDMILSDVRMPRLDGPSLYAALERRDPQLLSRTAFVSGDTLSPSARVFLQRVHRPYMEKPFSLEEVRALVDQILGRQHDRPLDDQTAATENR